MGDGCEKKMLSASIRFFAFIFGFVALYLGIVAIPTGLFMGAHVFCFGLVSVLIAYRFLVAGSRRAHTIKSLWRLQLDCLLLAIGGTVLTYWPWGQLEVSSLITWSILTFACALLSFLVLLEQRKKSKVPGTVLSD